MGESRAELILENILGASHELGEPQSRIEVLLMELLEEFSGGGVTDVQVNGSSVVVDGIANIMSLSTETIEVADWNGGTTATISVTGVTASNMVMVSPSPSDYSDYAYANIRCTTQASGQLTFTCDTTPSADIDVNIAIWG